MIKKCRSKKDYSVKAMKWIEGKKHTPSYDLVIFKKGYDYVWKIKEGIYYVADTYKHLRHMLYYDDHIEYFEKEEFNEYFYYGDYIDIE